MDKEETKTIDNLRRKIYDVWYNTNGNVDEKIEMCIQECTKVIFPEYVEKYYRLLDKFDGV